MSRRQKQIQHFDRNDETNRKKLGIFYLFLDTDVFSEKAQRCITAENAGEVALAVVVCQLLHSKVGGDDGGAAVDEPLVDAKAESGQGKGVGKFGTQIVDNQQVAV